MLSVSVDQYESDYTTQCSNCGVTLHHCWLSPHSQSEPFIITKEGVNVPLRSEVRADKSVIHARNPVCPCGRVLDDAEAWGV